MNDIRQLSYQVALLPSALTGLQHSAGNMVVTEQQLNLQFKSNKDVYQLAFTTEQQKLFNGFSLKLKLQGWQEIKYLAIGYQQNDHYIHIKASNIAQGEWFELDFAHQDLIFQIQNQWQSRAPCQFDQLKIYIKGTPNVEQAELSVENITLWLEQPNFKPNANLDQYNAALVNIIKTYWRQCYPDYVKQGCAFHSAGQLPIGFADTIPWDVQTELPITSAEPTTYRYFWHALSPALVLMLTADEQGLESLLYSARELVNQWLDTSYYKPDIDQKYCWYDHGTAERALVLLVMWQLGLKHNFDYRFMARLKEAVVRHAQLLSSEAFYAYHQPYRYHNHAWFQDIALIACGIAFASNNGSQKWIAKGEKRLADQLQHLVVRDSGFAIFTENSIGYHQGVKVLVNFGGQLLNLAKYSSEISQIALEFRIWSEEFIYPDGRFPAQGDTFRQPNPIAKSKLELPAKWSAKNTLLKKAGYLVVTGGNKAQPWLLTMLATNLNPTHKHQDDLAITFWFDGIEWLTDPSFFSHEYSKELPAFLRSAAAHNMLWVPSAKYDITPVAGRTHLALQQHNKISRVVGSSRACRGYTIGREIEYQVKQRLPVISGNDFFVSDNPFSDQATALLTFHFADGVMVQRCKNNTQQYLITHTASTYCLRLNLSANAEHVELKAAACGLAFMESSATTLMNITVKPKQKISWSLTVERAHD